MVVAMARAVKCGDADIEVAEVVPVERQGRNELPSMRKFADLLKDVLANDIPGHSNISLLKWSGMFGKGAITYTSLQRWASQGQVPSLESAIALGVLMKEAGANVGVFDFLLAAADGVYWAFVKNMRDQGVSQAELGDYSGLGAPEEASLSLPVSTIIDTYKSRSFVDRKAAAPELLTAIVRDITINEMPNERDVVQLLVKEAIVRQGNHPDALAKSCGVPKSWIEDIKAGRWEQVKTISTVGMLIKLAAKVPDLDGRKGSADFFASLMPDSDIEKARAEIQRDAAMA